MTAITITGPEDEAATIEQDLLDGFALRRLREALPDDWRLTVVNGRGVAGWRIEAEGHHASVLCDHDYHHAVAPRRSWGSGQTLAEAADKCREALP